MTPDSAIPPAVTPEKAQVLAALTGGPLGASQITERTGIAKTSLGRILDELAADGKVRRGDVGAVPGRAGRRPVLWELTPLEDANPAGALDAPGPDSTSPQALIDPDPAGVDTVVPPHENDAGPSMDIGGPISVPDPPEAGGAQALGPDDADPAGTVDPSPGPDAARDGNAMPDADPHDLDGRTSADPGVDVGTQPDVADAGPAQSGDGAAGGEATVEGKVGGKEHDDGTAGNADVSGQPIGSTAGAGGGGGVCAAVACPLAACPVRAGNAPVSPARRRARPTVATPKANSDGSQRLAPGELGRQIAAFLRANAEAQLTAGEIARELGGRSSGAVAAALPKLVDSGQVVAVNPGARPARFQTAPVAAGVS
ncbi:hypothetical protein FF36_05583 [Frankia torreyi]|uniref:Uncharacterized protein n=1 Tax=Frankia torreyi TaxID=1856 RepID=A0A0D8B9N3_9ACTN|nr:MULTISPECIES: helix-turn-helix domain-containing protein [Frankia]KJE20092.1 hypothetical protein FF36_05583 [Frankia torreyi]KQM02371.1 hypothetical protein FF86_10692 [Frankia sp. CpI1-P]